MARKVQSKKTNKKVIEKKSPVVKSTVKENKKVTKSVNNAKKEEAKKIQTSKTRTENATKLKKNSFNYNSLYASIPARFKTFRTALLEKKTNRRLILLFLGLIILLSLAYLANRYLVIAWVDRKPVTRFQLYSLLDKRYGKDTSEQLITQALIESEAAKQNVTVSNDEISNEIKKLENQYGGTDQLNQLLQAQGITQDDLHTLVKLQLFREKIFGKDITVSDQEISQYKTANKDQLPNPTTASESAQLDNQIKDQIKQQKVNQKFNDWLQSVLNSNRVTRVGQ